MTETETLNRGNFVRVIENLIDRGFIKLLEPFGNKNKDMFFRILDFYSVFYFKYTIENVERRNNTW